MSDTKRCERCGKAPDVLSTGPFAGSYGMLDYCEFCSQDLCETCMKEGRCQDSIDHKHKAYAESD